MIKYLNFDESELDIPLYRIITIERFFELLKTNKNTLVSPSLWEDPFEAFITKAKITIDGRKIKFNQRTWGQCWTTRIKETDAMWRIYTPNKNGVKIRTTARKLIASFIESDFVKKTEKVVVQNNRSYSPDELMPKEELQFYCGRIKYLSQNKIIDKDFLKGLFIDKSQNLLFVKRLEFEHEWEFRIVFEHFADFLDNYHELLLSYDFRFCEIIDEIVFDPRMDINMYEAYSKYVFQNGFPGRIIQSRLYSLPKYNFEL